MVECKQYACLNNTGIQKGKIHFKDYPEGYCKLEQPKIIDFGDGVWGCEDERYPNDFKKPIREG